MGGVGLIGEVAAAVLGPHRVSQILEARALILLRLLTINIIIFDGVVVVFAVLLAGIGSVAAIRTVAAVVVGSIIVGDIPLLIGVAILLDQFELKPLSIPIGIFEFIVVKWYGEEVLVDLSRKFLVLVR